MLSVSFKLFGTLHFFLFVLTFLYATEFYYLVLHGRRVYWLIRKISGSFTLLTHKEINFYIILQAFLILTIKLNLTKEYIHWCLYIIYVVVFLALIKILLYLSKLVILTKEDLSTNFTVLMFCFVVLVNVIFASNLILFFFILELLSVVYYLFFLSRLSISTLTVIKYRNLVTFYLWTSFLILITFFASSLFIIYNYGTLNFVQLFYFADTFNIIVLHLIFFSLLWKIGAPGFHFFKLEIYQFLPLYTLLLFSSVSLFLNFFLLQFLFTNLYPIIFAFNNLFLLYVSIFNLILLQRAQAHLPFYEFLGYSSINTLGIIFLFFIA